MTDQKLAIDLTKIAFPSDAISIRNLRQLFPGEFDGIEDIASMPFQDRDEGVAGWINQILFGERDLAAKAYAEVKARATVTNWAPHSDWKEERQAQMDELVALYQEAGLATGPHQAKQIIERFLLAAAGQARQHFPHTPPQR